MKTANDLAEVIRNNKSCEIHVDNDNWYITNDKNEEIANNDNYEFNTQWYSSSSEYAIGVAEALVILLNENGYNIKANAV